MRLCVFALASAAAFAQSQTAVRCMVVEAGTGAPIEGVHVRMSAALTGDRVTLVYGAVSDREGRFSVDPIPAGGYIVSLIKPGFLGRRMRGGMPTDRLITDAKDCRFEMSRRSGISGRVLDAQGDPVADVVIRLYTEGGELAEWSGVPQWIATDSRGMYRVSPAAGRYRLKAEPPHEEDWPGKISYGPAYYPGVIDARPGAELTGIDIRMEPWRAGTISGIVVGAPAGEKVTVKYFASVNRGSAGNETEAAQDGSFAFRKLQAGSYRLMAETPSGSQSDVVRIALGDGESPVVRLTVVRPFDVSGTIIRPAGLAVRSMRIDRVVPGLDSRDGFDTAVADDGSFRLERVAPGKYAVRVFPESEDVYVKSPSIIDLPAPGKLAIAVGGHAARISGTVDATHGFATVQLLPDGGVPAESMRIVRAQNGTFEFRNVPPGRYRLLAADPASPWNLEAAEVLDVAEGDRIVKQLKVADAK
jgi:hypothetical protein